MPRGLVLVIEDDEWVSRLLESAIRDADYDVIVCATAKHGLDVAFSKMPECIVCDVDLPDQDGYTVARHVRTHPSRVSVTPFLFLSALDDEESRIEGFHVGADVYITKPFRVDEVVAQIEALVHMATRLRARRDSMLSLPPGASHQAMAIEGDLSQMSIATVLTVLEMERRTGTFEVVSKKRRAQLDILGGSVIEGVVGGTKVSALAALRTMLAWKVGRFSFAPGPARDAPQVGGNVTLGAFLIEALRLEDEATRSELELPPSRRRAPAESMRPPTRVVAPALGGPASSPADFAPPSTRTPRPSELSLLLDPEQSGWEAADDIAASEPEPSTPAGPRAPQPFASAGERANPPPAPPVVPRHPIVPGPPSTPRGATEPTPVVGRAAPARALPPRPPPPPPPRVEKKRG